MQFNLKEIINLVFDYFPGYFQLTPTLVLENPLVTHEEEEEKANAAYTKSSSGLWSGHKSSYNLFGLKQWDNGTKC